MDLLRDRSHDFELSQHDKESLNWDDSDSAEEEVRPQLANPLPFKGLKWTRVISLGQSDPVNQWDYDLQEDFDVHIMNPISHD